MKRIVFIVVFFFVRILIMYSQKESAFETPLEKTIFSSSLKDSVKIEIIIPSVVRLSEGIDYPVIYLFDRQNTINYNYNLQTINYLTQLNAIPASIIVGISLENSKRGKWTKPNATGGKADDFIAFITSELNAQLKKDYPVSNFNILIGHSRTAIFSLYALSTHYDFFRAVIASSASNFDFGDQFQKKKFVDFLNKIESLPSNFQLLFSSGTYQFRDPHEKYVDEFIAFLTKEKIPKNLYWKSYKEDVDHYLIPGLTVNRALCEIFKPYRLASNNCLNIVTDSTFSQSVPWDSFMNEYKKLSSKLGFNVYPDLLFFNTIASEYANDYKGNFKEKKNQFCIEVLLECLKYYPKEYETEVWLAEVYVETGNIELAKIHYLKARTLIQYDTKLTLDEKNAYSKEIDQILESKGN